MKKTKVKAFGITMTCIALLVGCIFAMSEFASYMKDKKEAFAEKSAKASSSTKKQSYIMEDLDEVIDVCLTKSNRKNSAGYPLDESFFLWFYSTYGENIFRKLGDSIAEGEDATIYSKLTGSSLHVLWIKYCAIVGVHEEYLKNVYVKESQNSSDIVINFAGDINFDENWKTIQYADQNNIGVEDCLVNGLIEQMRDADIMMINNEFSYGTGGTPLPGKAYTFRARPDRADNLKRMGVDIVSVANNHVFDYGEKGLRRTLETLEDYKIPYVGAGRNLDEASQIVYFLINGKKIAITAATQIERTYNYTKEATSVSPGVLKTLQPDKYVRVIKEARKNADYVIAFVHWGTEGKTFFEKDQVKLARDFVIAGADAIIGGHTHCLQGIEFYDRVPIFYSLGNFWFDWDVSNSHETGMVQIIIHEDGSCDYRFIPCYYNEYKTRLLTEEEEKEEAYRYMERLSYKIKIDKDGYVKKAGTE